MKTNFQQMGDYSIVEIEGEVDAEHAANLKRCLQQATEGIYKGLALDLSGVTFIDSTGLGILISLMRQLKEEGKALRLIGLTDEVRSIFEITRLHRVFELADNVEAAIQEMRAKP